MIPVAFASFMQWIRTARDFWMRSNPQTIGLSGGTISLCCSMTEGIAYWLRNAPFGSKLQAEGKLKMCSAALK